jgi:hypothetical protein
MKRFAALSIFCALPLLCQTNSGELHLKVTDPSGLGMKTTVEIVSEANQYRNTLTTDEQGNLTVQRLPYGVYQLQIKQAGFCGRIGIGRSSILDSNRPHHPTKAYAGQPVGDG